MNLPNKLTLLRILLIPVFVVFAIATEIPGSYLLACAIFSIAAFTDFLDGYIARKYGMVTDFGKFADPLADKILTTTALLFMMADGVCHPIVLVLILTREFAVSGVRMVAAGAPGGVVIAANIWGKAKTVLQMVVIILYYMAMGVAQIANLSGDVLLWIYVSVHVLCWIVAALTALSGVLYIYDNRRFINTAK